MGIEQKEGLVQKALSGGLLATLGAKIMMSNAGTTLGAVHYGLTLLAAVIVAALLLLNSYHRDRLCTRCHDRKAGRGQPQNDADTNGQPPGQDNKRGREGPSTH